MTAASFDLVDATRNVAKGVLEFCHQRAPRVRVHLINFAAIQATILRPDNAGEKTTIDGLRVDFDKGWGLIRASNTAPALTLRFEAQNENGIEQLKTLFKRELSKVDQSLPLDF